MWAPVQLFDRGREVVEEVAAADVDDEGVANRLLGAARELGDLADEHRRQVVDHEEAEVLEHVGGLGPSAPDMPVMIVTSRVGLARHAVSIVPGGRRPRAGGFRRSRPCRRAYTAFADRVGQPRSREQLLFGQLPQLLDRTELPQQPLLAAGPETGTSSSTDRVIFLSRSWR